MMSIFYYNHVIIYCLQSSFYGALLMRDHFVMAVGFMGSEVPADFAF